MPRWLKLGTKFPKNDTALPFGAKTTKSGAAASRLIIASVAGKLSSEAAQVTVRRTSDEPVDYLTAISRRSRLALATDRPKNIVRCGSGAATPKFGTKRVPRWSRARAFDWLAFSHNVRVILGRTASSSQLAEEKSVWGMLLICSPSSFFRALVGQQLSTSTLVFWSISVGVIRNNQSSCSKGIYISFKKMSSCCVAHVSTLCPFFAKPSYAKRNTFWVKTHTSFWAVGSKGTRQHFPMRAWAVRYTGTWDH